MPAYCAPPPGNMKTTSGSLADRRVGEDAPRLARLEQRRRLRAARGRRARGAARSARRPACSVKATSASGCSGCARRCAAEALAVASSSAARDARRERPGAGRPVATAAGRRAAGASSRTTCALVPPTPSELTPARRGAAARGPVGAGCALTTERARRRSRSPGSAPRSPRLGGICAVLERQRRLDQAGDAGGGVEMADVGLDRADAAEARAVGALRGRPAVSAAISIGSPR